MKEALQILNRMQADGVISSYAIAGAVGATFYLEPSATVDLEFFVALPEQTGLLLSLSPICEYHALLGYQAREEYVDIAGWPVQFLPIANELEREALVQAISIDFTGVPTRVVGPEHLIAIALKTGRSKDNARILQFVSEGAFDEQRLKSIIEKHKLFERWTTFKARFFGE